MSENDEIRISLEEGIKTLTINLPNKRNALSAPNALRMAREIEKSEEDNTRVVVLTGAGGAFCAGADLAQRGLDTLGQSGAPTGEGEGWRERGQTYTFDKIARHFGLTEVLSNV